MEESDLRFLIFIVAAAATIVATLITTYASRSAATKERRRVLYGEAIQAAVSWNELLYRVRRRRDNKEHAREIIDKFHDAQDRLSYYQGWVASESRYLARSYRRLVSHIKTETEPLIQKAWNQPVRKLSDSTRSNGDSHPNIDAQVDHFVCDIRSHLSWQPWRKLAVTWRNRASQHNTATEADANE